MTGAAAAAASSGPRTISVSFSPTSVSGFSDTGAMANITTASVTATPSGGIPAYTYSWALIDGSSYTWTIGAAAAASTTFTAQNVPVGVRVDGSFELTVTDSAGNTVKKQIVATVRNKVTDFNVEDRFTHDTR